MWLNEGMMEAMLNRENMLGAWQAVKRIAARQASTVSASRNSRRTLVRTGPPYGPKYWTGGIRPPRYVGCISRRVTVRNGLGHSQCA